LFGEALFADGEPVAVAPAVFVTDDVDDGPMTTCETVVAGMIDVSRAGVDDNEAIRGTEDPTSVAVIDEPTAVPVAIVTVGTPATDAHTLSNAGMKGMDKNNP
jgi:hypothetical protein